MAKVSIRAKIKTPRSRIAKLAAVKAARATARRALARFEKGLKKAWKSLPSKFRDKDYGYRKRLVQIQRMKGLEIRVGILDAAGSERKRGSKLTVAEIAAFHEFGTKRIPRRSFIRGWFDEKKTETDTAISRITASVVGGKRTADEAANILGQAFVGGIQRRMSEGISPALAASTIKRKGSSTPLIDTGQLRTSVSYEIRRR